MNLQETRITASGVFRCCLATVAEEYEGKDGAPDKPVEIGMTSKCRHCSRAFVLVAGSPPRWTPVDQLGVDK